MNKIAPQKILHLAKFYQPHLGGVETHLWEVNKILVKAGHKVQVITLQHDPDLALQEKNIIRIPIGEFKLKLAGFLDAKISKMGAVFPLLSFPQKLFFKIKLWTWILKQSKLFLEADIIQVHDVFWWIWPLYPLIYYKTFITFHGWEGQYPVRPQVKLQRRINSMSAKKVMHIGGWIKRFYGDKPDVVSYGGVNLQKSPSGNLKNQFAKKINKIVLVGRLEAENEIEQYLAIFKKLHAKNKSLKIVFVGDGALRGECEKLGQVTGWVKNLRQYLVSADLVFANSYLSILEVQALGKMVGAIYSHPLKKAYLETFPGKKYMLVAGGANDLAQKILDFEKLAPAKKQVLSKKIVTFAKSQTWEKVADAYKKIWDVPSR